MAEKPRPDEAPDDTAAPETESGETWVVDQALELHKLISDRHAPEHEDGGHS
jgi:hypothetical protein